MNSESDEYAAPGCGDPARELLDFYLNGSLDEGEAEAVRVHLASCAACAAELAELSALAAAVAGHGAAAESPWSRRRPALWWAGVAAAALLAAVSARLYVSGPERSGARHGSAAGPVEIRLDLGTGALRDSGSPPILTLAPGTEMLRLTFFPPVQAGARYLVSVRRVGGDVILPEAPLSSLDPMGRADVVLPVEGIAPGPCEITLKLESAEGEVRSFTYPFEIRHADRQP